MRGKVWKFGDDIDTDIILPGRYLIHIDQKILSKHCMEGIDSEFYKKVSKGDIIVGGKNFGCGSSREHAPIAIQGAGIGAVIAESFARIFYRNSTNIGMPLLEASGITKFLNQGDEIEIDMKNGFIIKEDGSKYEFKNLPSFMLNILEKGGLIEYLKKKNLE
ncbi:MAG: 3-isopropylmalate dehydratase small subunit [Methanobrevibacter sp.]|jgi:3-isopropylmalate/(R)-2-methylmalate dehydratase small subunit|nr:3-isopropylmalate dehydratase small subunit [Candidatus Methanovirga basalitermitum]